MGVYAQIHLYTDMNFQLQINLTFTVQWYCFLLLIIILEIQELTQSYL